MLSPDGLPNSDTSTNPPKNGGYDSHDLFDDELGPENEHEPGDAGTDSAAAEKNLGIRIDAICRVAFPFNFIIFNICYWCYYLNY